MLKRQHAVVIVLAAGLAACGESSTLQVADGTGSSPKLPEPNKTLIPTVNIAPAVGWSQGAKPIAAEGLQVSAFAEDLDHPRWLYVLPNGDVLVAETNAPPKPDDSKGIRGWVMEKVMGKAGAGVPSANRITLLRDANHDGIAETRSVFLQNLNSPFGMALVGNDLYVADSDKLLRFPYQAGADSISAQPTKVVDLPGGPLNHHWTKNVIASPDGKKLYVTVGSNSNVGENGMDKEEGRAAIWEVDPATGSHRIFASGLRNPNGMDWEPATGKLWTAVNERDEIGSDLVPDYITSVKDGGFYGWPYSYYGQHVDVRVDPQNPELVAKAIAPDFAVGPHTASLGLSFADGSKLPNFTEGAFIGQHGSWNRKPHSGYKVIFVPFADGKPTGMPMDVLTGFLNADEKAMGRPVGVVIDKQGDLLVADDVGNKVWRVSAK
ncbi:Glucose/arabinose dehydrogenase, beta-propeller fold [Pseudomonas lundensis]|uniref:PQQ-dependent sugar dehydrogenase n=1 Tax=Pseudomonas lundensis TaxID=86185 RepID=UPI0008863E26|nr:sorbosone dehydrogenase family protein [Pseudomonas lundensis]MBM1182671.1 sorbosone dehydrogenase family protein [Pseudomonas lundensis]NNA26284.1 sorbosone dehydrogenase family protein [Pseudomonas lundensis]SDQ87923.1 Glucose/arabinose dehydrogenase, beta-propeller fold [Pseudomonas lundensis]